MVFWTLDELDESLRWLKEFTQDSIEWTQEELDEFLYTLDELRSTWTVDLDFDQGCLGLTLRVFMVFWDCYKLVSC